MLQLLVSNALRMLFVMIELAAMRYCMEDPVDSDPCDMQYTRVAT